MPSPRLILVGSFATLAVQQPPVSTAPPRQPPVLTAFAINDGDAVALAGGQLRLSHTVVGTSPTDYRVSTRADFVGAAWIPYRRHADVSTSTLPVLAGCDVPGAASRVRLFLQVRSLLGDEVRVVNGQRTLVPIMSESNVMADSICLTGPVPP